MLGESNAKELRKIPLADNIMGRRASDISEDLCDQLIDYLNTSRSAVQVDEATDVFKDVRLIT